MKKNSNRLTLLIVEDDEDYLESFVNSPILEKDYNLLYAESCQKALEILSKHPDIDFILLDFDFKFEKMNGLELLKILRNQYPDVYVFMMSGVTEYRGAIAIESIKNNAVAFFDKPVKIADFKKYLDEISLKIKSKDEHQKSTFEILRKQGFITKSESIAQQFTQALKTYNSLDVPILITGETGTGKTLLARILHKSSYFSEKSFYELHCRHLSHDINFTRSQLFGHIKGSYTGALSNKTGIFGEFFAVLLDDIHHLPGELQPFFLQILESKIFYRLGDDSHPVKFSGKILATSIYTINELKNKKYFIEELLYRLHGEAIHIPPLRERKEDISEIILHYANNYGDRKGKSNE